MWRKVNPHTLRVGVIKDWDSRWVLTDSINIKYSESVPLNGNKVKNLQTTKKDKVKRKR